MGNYKKSLPGETTNIYKTARLRAAQANPELSTAEKAAQLLLIRREKYLQIEQDDPQRKRAVPNQDEVAMMIHAYNAPELRSHYCANECPLGEGTAVLQPESLDRITVQLLVALRRMELARDDMYSILEDGVIKESEQERFRSVVRALKEISAHAASLELWAQQHGLIDL